MNERIISWHPCSGFTLDRVGANFPQNHVGEIRRDNESTDSWLDIESARQQYPNLVEKSSHTICPTCDDFYKKAVEG